MSPLPGHQVIPPGWSERHRPVMAGTHNATFDLYAGTEGPAPFPLPAGWVGPAPLATGVPCRVQRLVTENTGIQAEQVQGTRRYQITAPVDRVPELTVTDRGPTVTVHGGDDPQLAGLRLKVTDVRHGSHVWERVLVAVHNQTQD